MRPPGTHAPAAATARPTQAARSADAAVQLRAQPNGSSSLARAASTARSALGSSIQSAADNARIFRILANAALIATTSAAAPVGRASAYFGESNAASLATAHIREHCLAYLG